MDSGRRNGGGCLGCATVLALFVAVVAMSLYLVAPATVGLTVRAYAERFLESSGFPKMNFEELPQGVEAQSGGDTEETAVAVDTDDGSAGHDASQVEQWLRGKLDERGQDAYDQLLEGVRSYSETIVIIEAEPEDISAAYKAMMGDHPELFWLDGSFTYTYSSLLKSVTVQPGHDEVPLDQVEATRAKIEEQADIILGGCGEGASDYDIVRHVYEHIASNTKYKIGVDHNQTIQSVLLGQMSVCAGYARTFQYLLNRAGIFCSYVEGQIGSTGEEHAWNIVRIDGMYAFVDPTWADPAYAGQDEEIYVDGVIYDYLCLTTEEITRDDHVFADASLWPPCEAPELDFYRRSGLFMDSYDEQAIDESFWQQVSNGGNRAVFKFGSEEAYAQAVSALAGGTFERDSLLELAEEYGRDSLRYSYTTSDALRIVKLYW